MTIAPGNLALVRLVRTRCSHVVDYPGHVLTFESLGLCEYPDDGARSLCEAALGVPVETMAIWLDPGQTVKQNVQRVMERVAQNLMAAEAYARATGSVACTYDGVTWTR